MAPRPSATDEVARPTPLLVIVSGASGSGKTLLAPRLDGMAPRHPGHVDDISPEQLRALLAAPERLAELSWADYQALDLDVPCLRVDTTDGYHPDFEAIIAFARSAGATS